MNEQMRMEIVINRWGISTEDLPKGMVGKIMLDIIFCDPQGCRDKKAYLELVEETAKGIIENKEKYREEPKEIPNDGTKCAKA